MDSATANHRHGSIAGQRPYNHRRPVCFGAVTTPWGSPSLRSYFLADNAAGGVTLSTNFDTDVSTARDDSDLSLLHASVIGSPDVDPSAADPFSSYLLTGIGIGGSDLSVRIQDLDHPDASILSFDIGVAGVTTPEIDVVVSMEFLRGDWSVFGMTSPSVRVASDAPLSNDNIPWLVDDVTAAADDPMAAASPPASDPVYEIYWPSWSRRRCSAAGLLDLTMTTSSDRLTSDRAGWSRRFR